MIVQLEFARLTLIFAAVGSVTWADLPEYPTPLDYQIRTIVAVSPEKRDLSWVTPQIRPQVLARLKEALQYKSDRNWGLAGLVALEDHETINMLVSQWRTLPDKGPERGAALDMLVKNTPTGVLFPLLAQYLSDLQMYDLGGNDTPGDVTWREIASISIFDVIYARKEFPEATTAWAKEHGRDSDKYIQIKPWWEHNKELILARRYSEAAWLPTNSNGIQTNAATSLPQPISTSFRGEAKSSLTKVAQTAPLTEPSNSKIRIVWAVVILSATGLLWLVLKKCK